MGGLMDAQNLPVENRNQQQGGGGSTSGGPPNTWAEDRDHIIEFLRDMHKIMDYLIRERIPDGPDALFIQVFPEITSRIEEAVTQLEKIASNQDDLYKLLEQLGLTSEQGRLKFREQYEGFTSRSVGEGLHTGDTILGSLCKALFVLEPVKEFKEILESRLKNGGDKGIIQTLGLQRRPDWWNKR